jgi:Tol biopolymer transport system component
VAPDGRSILFVASSPSQNTAAYLHDISTGISRVLHETSGLSFARWSFDSRSLLFVLPGSNLTKLDLDSGSTQQLSIRGANASWGAEGIIAQSPQGLIWFRPDGTDQRLIRPIDPQHPLVYSYPSLIPGGRWAIYNAAASNNMSGTRVSVRLASLDGKIDRELFKNDRAAVYASPGYILYLRTDTLVAQPIDPDSGALRGGPMSVVSPIARSATSIDPGAFSVSANGVLAFQRSNAVGQDRMVWFDRAGNRLGTLGDVADYSNPALSPDGNRLAVSIRDPATGKRDIWIFGVADAAAQRFTFDPADDTNPIWSPDGQRIAFNSDRRGGRDIYVKNASGAGAEELLFSSGLDDSVEDWSPDGRWISYNEDVPGRNLDLAVLSLETRKSLDFLRTPYVEQIGQFSPDGKWLAYISNDSARQEVYIRAFPPSGGQWQISNGGGWEPKWSGDGRELYYNTIGNPSYIMAVDITSKDGAIEHGVPHRLFQVTLTRGGRRWVRTPDGKKFLVILPPEQKPSNSFAVILNWPSLLKK